MGGGGKGGSQKQRTEIDPRLTAALLNNNAQSQAVANQLGVRQFADWTPDQLAAFGMVRDAAGMGFGELDQANQAYSSVGGYTPEQVLGGSLLDVDLSAYMNPYTQNVIDTSLADLSRQGQMVLGQNAAAAAKAGAFGGSRHGVVEAETNRALLDASARMAAGLRQDAFNTATGLATGDLTRALQAAMANQAAGLNAAQLRLDGAQGLSHLGALRQQMGLSGAAALGNIGSMQQALAQQQLDALRNLPLEQQQIRNTAMGLLSPLAGNTTTTMGYQPGWGEMLGQGLGVAALFMSDERVKRDIEPIKGRDALAKVGFLAGNMYRYKPGYGHTVGRTGGVMAQDVQRVLPGAVVEVGDAGELAVDYPQVTGLLVEAVKELDKRTKEKRA